MVLYLPHPPSKPVNGCRKYPLHIPVKWRLCGAEKKVSAKICLGSVHTGLKKHCSFIVYCKC
ncbi:hypothetical protein AB205_0209510 [Aquarana catesbeiana]|uniref:Uncharacterized protein n=1 Tax=Aquarana catesbeiana TaxID=8400 RepID=A0A2G9SHA8_AQUCT|nr:hypothetical protein AB205_0209510 [Aquarana catesbeiana]